MLGKKLIKAAAGNGAAGYQISRSLRFNSADSAYLNRTPASAGNRTTWTWSGWVKRSALNGVAQTLFSAGTGSTNPRSLIYFQTDNTLAMGENPTGASWSEIITTQLFRDVGAWYHIVATWDSGNATSSDRMRLYVNGTRITAFGTATYPSQNTNSVTNNNITHRIGRYAGGDETAYFAGYMAEVHFVDASALTPSSFGETDATTGVWKPIAYAGTYGTNGFHLDFSDNSSTTTLGYDAAGSNDWTLNNFSVTAGAGNDSLVDSPTQYGTDTGTGGEVRGNYCTLNPLAKDSGFTLTNGNLNASGDVIQGLVASTIFPSSGKWYAEYTCTTAQGDTGAGVASTQVDPFEDWFGEQAYTVGYLGDGRIMQSGSTVVSGSSFTTNDVIGVAFDVDTGKVWFAKNNTWQNSGDPAAGTGQVATISGGYPLGVTFRSVSTGAGAFNFGQRPFAYTAPSGFKALCTTNLPEPTVLQGDDYFNTVLWTGDGATTATPITGVGFQPDFVWIKERTIGYNHVLQDAVRGVAKKLGSNLTSVENDASTLALSFGYISSFDSDGFTLESTGTPIQTNRSGSTYVGWNWNAGGSNATNTDGTITSTVRANTTAGFSIVSYTGTGSASSIGHGLGATPGLIIIKQRGGTTSWPVWHQSFPSNQLYLNLTNALDTPNISSVGSSTFTVDTWAGVNASSGTYIAYCFAAIPGFSAFGSYTGNGSTDGPFVYTGFRPAFVVFKESSTARNWKMVDSTRSAYNLTDDQLSPNLSNAESVDNGVDILSNGFKLRSTDVATNDSGQTFIYMAFAENPFKYSLAR